MMLDRRAAMTLAATAALGATGCVRAAPAEADLGLSTPDALTSLRAWMGGAETAWLRLEGDAAPADGSRPALARLVLWRAFRLKPLAGGDAALSCFDVWRSFEGPLATGPAEARAMPFLEAGGGRIWLQRECAGGALAGVRTEALSLGPGLSRVMIMAAKGALPGPRFANDALVLRMETGDAPTARATLTADEEAAFARWMAI
jgi:hypothetical protein